MYYLAVWFLPGVGELGETARLTFRITLWRPWLLVLTPLALLVAVGVAVSVVSGERAAAAGILLGFAGVAVALLPSEVCRCRRVVCRAGLHRRPQSDHPRRRCRLLRVAQRSSGADLLAASHRRDGGQAGTGNDGEGEVVSARPASRPTECKTPHIEVPEQRLGARLGSAQAAPLSDARRQARHLGRPSRPRASVHPNLRHGFPTLTATAPRQLRRMIAWSQLNPLI